MGARFPSPSGTGFAGMTVGAEEDTAALKQDEAPGPAPSGDARPRRSPSDATGRAGRGPRRRLGRARGLRFPDAEGAGES